MRSVRARAAIGATLVVAVALVAAGLAVLLVLRDNLIGQADLQAEVAAREVAGQLALDTRYEDLDLDELDFELDFEIDETINAERVGDFDSLGQVPEGENIVRHPVMKDDTDMMLAVKLGLERGYTRFHIYGGMGGRTDHTIANIQTLAYIAGRGASAFL